MISLLLLASATTAADLELLGRAVATCDRSLVNPTFSAEAARRSQFMLATFREQEAIVAQRRDLAARRHMTLQQPNVAADATLALTENALEDRQRALNEERHLESLRRETIDTMRRQFLQTCPAGRPKN